MKRNFTACGSTSFTRLIAGIALTQICYVPMASANYYSDLYEVPDYAPFILDKRVEKENYNFKFGEVMIDLIGTFGIEYDDNINSSETDELDDVILQPGLSFGLKWQISESQEFDLNLGFEYWYYTDNNDRNDFDTQFLLTPETEVSFRVLVGDMVFRAYDKLTYSFDATDATVVDPETGDIIDSNPDEFTRWTNTFGLQSEWFIGEYAFSTQLSRQDEWSPDDEYEYIDNYEHKLALNVERDYAANFTAGVGTSYRDKNYDKDVNADAEIFSIGPYMDWKITEVIGLYAGVAWNHADYDDALANTGAFEDDTSYEDFTGTVRLSHVLNDVFNHQIEAYRALEDSDTSSYDELEGIRYSASYTLNSRIRLEGDVAYEEVDSSGGLLNDDYDRWNTGLATELVLGPRLNCRIGYRYIDKDSDVEGRSYERNRFRILFEYDF